MVKVWDDTMKRLVSAHPHDFIVWLARLAQKKRKVVETVEEVPEARPKEEVRKGDVLNIAFRRFLDVKLKDKRLEADKLIEVEMGGCRILLHVEFQSSEDETMERRMLEYSVLADSEHQLPVLSFVIYLRKASKVAKTPYVLEIKELGLVILEFHFIVIEVYELLSEEIVKTDCLGLFPLLPLTKDGKQLAVLDMMIKRLVDAERIDLLTLGETLAGLVWNDEEGREMLKRRFAVHKDIVRESWVFQEILHEGEEKVRLQIQEEVLQVVQRRFPSLTEQVKMSLATVDDPMVALHFAMQVNTFSNGQELQDALNALKPDQESKGQS
jgi:hypothetical protein